MTAAILTDIEGTTSSISFVRDVLFPYARRALPGFVREHGHEPQVRQWLDAVATEAGGLCQDAMIVETLQGWIDQDRKHTALKALQGLVWEAGYRNADFTAPIYPDAAQTLQRWHALGLPLYVYSSGSVPAQKLFFGHSDAGDLTGLFSLHVGDKVYEVLCEKGDLIVVPDSATHWFDMGPAPRFVAIRFFTEADGWVGPYSATLVVEVPHDWRWLWLLAPLLLL